MLFQLSYNAWTDDVQKHCSKSFFLGRSQINIALAPIVSSLESIVQHIFLHQYRWAFFLWPLTTTMSRKEDKDDSLETFDRFNKMENILASQSKWSKLTVLLLGVIASLLLLISAIMLLQLQQRHCSELVLVINAVICRSYGWTEIYSFYSFSRDSMSYFLVAWSHLTF